MTDAPPALSSIPQFTAEHWTHVPRRTAKAEIGRITNKDDPDGGKWVQIVLKQGVSFMRRKEEIQQLLSANLEVEVEMIVGPQGELVTGLFVPGCGWAFRMTAEDLAEYTRDVASYVYEQQRQQKLALIEHMAKAVELAASELGVELPPYSEATNGATFIALAVAGSLETPQQ